jgi:hypothetical protein
MQGWPISNNFGKKNFNYYLPSSFMRAFLLLFLVQVSVLASGQGKSFKYIYKFGITRGDKQNHVTVDTGFNQSWTGVSLKLTDSDAAPAFVYLVDVAKRDTLKTMTDIEGFIQMKSNQGRYKLIVLASGSNRYSQELDISDKETLSIYLKPGFSLDILYDVYSKKPLSKSELSDIKSCMEANPSNNGNCDKKRKYIIMTEI